MVSRFSSFTKYEWQHFFLFRKQQSSPMGYTDTSTYKVVILVSVLWFKNQESERDRVALWDSKQRCLENG